MKIGELSKLSGCSVQTIRYYEQEGLLSSAARSSGNYRLYDQNAKEQLFFIKRCRNLDLSLADVKTLLNLRQAPRSACDAVNQMVDQHIEHVEDTIAELQQLHHQLRALRDNCSQNLTVQDCGIIKRLAAP